MTCKNQKNPKALVLAGGLPQIALLQALRRRGYQTVLADYFEHPVARPYADIFYQVSTLDVPGITKIAVEEQVDFLITVCTDQALQTVAQVSEQLGLPCYVDYETALQVTNKSHMKAKFSHHGIPTANYVVLETLEPEKIAHLRYPLIVKPVDCNSSKGVCRVEDPDSMQEAFSRAVTLSRTATVVVEEFVEGPEMSVDVYVHDGVATVLAVSELDKVPCRDKFVIFRSKTPKCLTSKLKENIRQAAQRIADAFGLRNSPMLIQLICKSEQVYVLEFSARTGGGEKFRMIERLTGFDVVDAVVRLTIGEPCAPVPAMSEDVVYASEFLYGYKGVFDHMEGVDSLLEQNVLCDFYPFKTPGSVLGGLENSSDRVAGFSIVASDRRQLQEKHEIAVRTLRVIDTEGQDILRRDILTRLYDAP